MGRSRILIRGLTGLVLVIAAEAQAGQPVPDGYARVAAAHGVPAEALYAVSLSESSRTLSSGVRPWPWTLNVAGKGYRYNSRIEAWRALQGFMKHHSLRRIDVGLAQVNLGWNGHHFTSTWEAFEPYTNLNAAATILRECWMRRPGSWLDAAGCYHHPAGGAAAARYRNIVRGNLARITPSRPADLQAAATPQAVALLTPAPGVVQTGTGRPLR
ncbi:lytic transglycosylase domain-containing protein [Erwinia mallotivora]|uniref:lytic transglycosylase domain-containing protein n=1 Tax=Erwinia mallotivora TaxID=69222 RepID=UPI0021BF4D0E|nr:lytic transglycosylase domain-containing protein [Erwinia mallotivora]